MLNPESVAHLIFRNTVAESLDSVAAGQANFAVVPLYNTITQWDGATLKALSTGQFEIFAEVCMPTSYVLVAHQDYMSEFVRTYASIKDPNATLTREDEAKIYTRFLTKIYVSNQAEQQYRGRLLRPDMTQASVELSRNPLRVLEEITRSDLVKAMMRGAPPPTLPGNQSGGGIHLGVATAPVMDSLQAPAALVAQGLLEAPGNPEGWDRPGSLGEIVGLLRKLLVLLDVYSFGAPDLPQNSTQYVLLGRRGDQTPLGDAIERFKGATPPTMRVMTLVRSTAKHSSADEWLKPRKMLAERLRKHSYVLDRPPVMVSPGGARVFLFEGGKPKGGLPEIKPLLRAFGKSDSKEKTDPKSKLRNDVEKKPRENAKDKTQPAFLGEFPTWCHGMTPESCWCCNEAHAEESTTTAEPTDVLKGIVAALIAVLALALIMVPFYCAFSGSCTWWGSSSPRYQPPLPPTESSAPAEEQSAPSTEPKTTPPASSSPTPPVVTPDRPRDNSSAPPSTEAKVEEPKVTAPPVTTPAPPPVVAPAAPPAATTQGPKVETTKETTTTAYPGVQPTTPPARTNPYPNLTKNAPPPTYTPESEANKGPAYDWSKPQPSRTTTTTTTTAPAMAPLKTEPPKAAPRIEAPKPPTFHVAFFEAKTNLSYEAMNAVTASAAQAIQTNRIVLLRIVALGPRETNSELWRRRLYAVKDELVRLGVPADRIRWEGQGPYVLTIRPNQPAAPARSGRRAAYTTDSIPDPMSQD